MALATTAGCATQDGDDVADGETNVQVGNTKADGQAQVEVSEGHYRTLTFTTADKPVDIAVYCTIPRRIPTTSARC